MTGVKINRFFLLCFLWLACQLAHALDAHEPVVDIKLSGGSFLKVATSVSLPLKPCEAYAMLTDYDHLPSFIPGLLESHSRRVSGNTVMVRQVGEVQVFIFHVRMESLLDMEETPNRRILFKQVEGDLASYEGEWRLSATADGTLVDYDATLSFKPYVPLLLARSILRDDVRKKFVAIGKEAMARKRKGGFDCAPKK